MKQSLHENSIVLANSSPQADRRTFLKKTSGLAVAGGLSLGATGLLLPGHAATVIKDTSLRPDTANFTSYIVRYTGTQLEPAINRQTVYSDHFYVNKNASTSKDDVIQIWRRFDYRTIDTDQSIGDLFFYDGQVRSQSAQDGTRDVRIIGATGTVLAIIPAEIIQAAQCDGRRLTQSRGEIDKFLASLIPAGATQVGTPYRSARLLESIPQFMYVSYILAGRTYYRFVQVNDSPTYLGWLATEAWSVASDTNNIITTIINALNDYDKTIGNTVVSATIGVATGAGVGLTLGLTADYSSFGNFGIAGAFLVGGAALGTAVNTYFYAIPGKQRVCRTAIGRLPQSTVGLLLANLGVCPANNNVRI